MPAETKAAVSLEQILAAEGQRLKMLRTRFGVPDSAIRFVEARMAAIRHEIAKEEKETASAEAQSRHLPTEQTPVLAAKPAANRVVAYHSGDRGDIIYSIPTCRALGVTDLVLGPDNRSPMKTREVMGDDVFNCLAPLLRAQRFLSSVSLSAVMPADTRHDLNRMRTLIVGGKNRDLNLARVHLRAFGLDEQLDRDRWLEADYKAFHPEKPIIVNRTGRYHTNTFPWIAIVKEFGSRLLFIGLKEEHEMFCSRFGSVGYQPTSNLLDVARLIAGASLFIGNQSCCYAIAEGLKKPAILEEYPSVPNCRFDRPDVVRSISSVSEISRSHLARCLTKPIVIRSHLDDWSGYGQLVNNLTRSVLALGTEVFFTPVVVSSSFCQVPSDIASRIRKDLHPNVLVATHDSFPMLLRAPTVVITMWESSKWNPKAIGALNSYSPMTIVPNQWNADCLRACGLKGKCAVMPLGINPTVFRYRKPNADGLCIFGTAGRFAHGGCRKGLEETVNAFLKAFPTNPDVRLDVKLFQDCKIAEVNDKRVRYIRGFLTSDKLAEWYGTLTAFVSGSRAEGWGLHQHQCMGVGRPVIACCYAGLREFFDETVGYPIPFKVVPATGVYKGMGDWSEPDFAAMSEMMRKVADNRKTALALGQLASIRAHAFTWDRTARRFLDIVSEVGLP